MSMASYNLLKAAADGLADAINYRTNLKRRRREEEYDYNKKWERNEQEYQRDLQRGRNEEQWNFDLKQKRTEQERARKEDWLNANSPYYDIQTNDPLSYDIYDARAAINDVPIAAKYREPVKDTFAQDMAKLERQHQNRMAEIDANNRGRMAAASARGGGRQPIDYNQQFEDWLAFMGLDKTPENYALWKRGVLSSPKAVKDNFDPFDKTNYYKNIINGLYEKASQIMPPQEVELVKQMIELENTPEEKLSKENRKKMKEYLEKAFNGSKEESKARMNYLLNEARTWLQQGNNHIQYRTNGKYGMHINSGNTINLEAEKIANNDAAKNYADTINSDTDQLLGKAKGMAQSGQNVYPQPASSSVDLYHETPASNEAKALLDSGNREVIPPSVKPFGDVPASATQQLDQNIIDLVQNYRNSIEIQRKAGVMGLKMYRQTVSMLDDMMTAYARGEITADVIERTLRPSVYKKNLMTGAKSYDY